MSSNDGFYDFTVIIHLCHYFRFLSLLTRGLHCSKDFGLLAFGNATEAYSITTHSGSNAFLQSAVLTAITIYTQNVALLVFRARPVLYLLLNRATEKSLAAFTRVNAIMKPRGLVTTNPAQHLVIAIKF
jgi:hypothetical protein